MTPSFAARASAALSASGVPPASAAESLVRASASAPVAMAARAARSAASIPGSVVGPGSARSRASSGRAPASSSRTARASSRNSASESCVRRPRGVAVRSRARRRGGRSQRLLDLRRAGGRRPASGERVERRELEHAQVGVWTSPSGARGARTRRGRAEQAAPPTPRARARPSRAPAWRRWASPCRRAASASTSRRCVTRGAGARRAHDLDLGRRDVAARERVDGGAGAQRVALHELVDALGHEHVAERVDGVVERRAARPSTAWPSGAQRRQRRWLPNGIVVSSQTVRGDARAPAPAQPEPVGDVARAHRLGHARLAARAARRRAPGRPSRRRWRRRARAGSATGCVEARRPARRRRLRCAAQPAERSRRRSPTAAFGARRPAAAARRSRPAGVAVVRASRRCAGARRPVFLGKSQVVLRLLELRGQRAACACAASSAGCAAASWLRERGLGRLVGARAAVLLLTSTAIASCWWSIATLRSCSAGGRARPAARARAARAMKRSSASSRWSSCRPRSSR